MANFIHNQFTKISNGFVVPLKVVASIAAIIFILSVFDAIISYIAPEIIIGTGVTETQMGLILASSALFGLLFDFILTKMLKVVHYWSLFLYTILLCTVMPLLFLVPSIFALILLAMAVWALYCNLWSFALSDFTARGARMAFHATGVGILYAFGDLGSVVGTIIIGPLQRQYSYTELLLLLIGIVVVALLFLIGIPRKKNNARGLPQDEALERVKLWRVVRKLWPLLLLFLAVYLLSAVKWTVTPIISRISENLDGYGGIILAMSILPGFVAYGLVGGLSKKIGKKKLAIYAFLALSVVTILEGLSDLPYIYITLVGIGGFIAGLIYSALGGVYADYLQESKSYDPEILITQDMAINMSYILGPILGGILMQKMDSILLYSVVGVGMFIIGIIVLISTPREIDFHDRSMAQ